MQMIIDGVASNKDLLGDVPSVSNWIYRVVELIGMQVLAGPVCKEIIYPEAKAGVSAVAIISESHIAVHTWTGKPRFNLNIDIFSCVPFDPNRVLGFTRAYWDLVDDTWQILPRKIGDK